MGNGQCPDCCGVPASWLGHPLHMNASGIGHKKNCILAQAIEEAGGKPLYVGAFVAETEYESCLIEMHGMLIHSTQVKGSNPINRAALINSSQETEKRINRILIDILTKSIS